jgi:hypothetical protein
MTINPLWEQAWRKETEGLDFANARVAGRATKLNPNKEDAAWWYEQGSVWTDNYILWRKNNPNWKIWTTPQGAKAIELELNPVISGVPVKMFIDRIFEVDGKLVIVDLKTSRARPQSDLQLGFYKVGVEMMLGVEVNLGIMDKLLEQEAPDVAPGKLVNRVMSLLPEKFRPLGRTGLSH